MLSITEMTDALVSNYEFRIADGEDDLTDAIMSIPDEEVQAAAIAAACKKHRRELEAQSFQELLEDYKFWIEGEPNGEPFGED